MTDLDAEFARILDGAASHAETLDFLARSTVWMDDPTALVAGARAMRARMLRVAAPDGAIDVCGTGGDGANTLNISTAVAFVVAGCGAPVAKHGNRAMSSRSGAADVLEALGAKLTDHVPTLENCLREARVAFLFAQHHHPAVRHVSAARREFGRRTIFNLLGPLANPAGVKRQLMGVMAPGFVRPMAEALAQLDCERAWVVHGAGGLDELSPAGNNIVADVSGCEVRPVLEPAAAPARSVEIGALRGGDAAENASALRSLLEGQSSDSGYAEIVILNAAAALVVAGVAADLPEGKHMALASLRERRAREALERLIAITKTAP
jgi:anthranilate phosphoribosyltransferase